MPTSNETLRESMLDAAESQLVASPDHDIVTRSVCEAVGVTQPVLYRLFGDKRGLLDALADRGLDRYIARKAELEVTDDPVADLIDGWDDHHAFAAENPALYQLMFEPRPWSTSRTRDALMAVLVDKLRRCAAIGELRVDPETAGRMILSADVGLAFNTIAQPDVFGDAVTSESLREAVFAAVLVHPPTRESIAARGSGFARKGSAIVNGRTISSADRPVRSPGEAQAETAIRLQAQLAVTPTDALAPEEQALLARWLDRLATQRA
jgi:AcrR family transcriptional regulator